MATFGTPLGSLLGQVYVSNGVPVGTIVQISPTWQGWNVVTSSSSVIYTLTIDQATATGSGYPSANYWYQYQYQQPHAYKPSPEEVARHKAHAAAAEAAVSRADQLLLSLLDDEQRDQVQREKFFELKVSGRVYRIHRGRAGNVQLVEGGKPVAKYCAHPDLWTPDGDAMIAQMMMLKTNEAEFLKIANRTALV